MAASGAAGFYKRLRKVLQAIEDAEGERPNGLEIVRRVEARGGVIGRSSVRRYLKEEGLPLIDSAEALALGLGVSAGWLAFGEGKMILAQGGELPPTVRRQITEELAGTTKKTARTKTG